MGKYAMTNRKWVSYTYENVPKKEEEKKELIRFWNEFYNQLSQQNNMSGENAKTKSVQYKEEVFDILHNSKASLPLGEAELHKIQMKIEDLTMLFDQESVLKSASNVI
jgi:hypothetical protein